MTTSGVIEGPTTGERAVAVAGWLAEQGVQGLCVLDGEAGWSRFLPRVTDLPGELLRRVSAGPVELLATDRPLVVVFSDTECIWTGSAQVGGSAPNQSADSDA